MVKLLNRKETSGKRDSFRILIDKHEDIFEEIRTRFLRKRLSVGFHEARIPMKGLHNLLLTRLREVGLTSNDYPFNVDHMGYRSMIAHLNSIYRENIIAGVKARIGDDTARRLQSSMNSENDKTRGHPYQRILADGHRLHAFMSVELPDLDGNGVLTTIDRPWLFLLMDECSRAILGYHLTLNSEYTQVDVMQAIKSALTPWKPKELTITGLRYLPGAGLPGGVIPELARASWEEFRVDNAKANLANLVRERLHALVGCDINAGPVNMPERRGVIEKVFGMLVAAGFGRLPSTTGSGPKDGRRRNPEKKAVEFAIMLHEIEELLDVIIANYNVTPNGGVLNGRSPLEYLSRYLAKGGIVTTIPEERMGKFNFFSIRVKSKIRGGLKQARAPHVNYQCVPYTNDLLRHSAFLVGTSVTLVVNIDDLRQVKVYLEDGTDFGVLTAHGSWGISPHDLKTRKAINHLKSQGKLSYFETTDPILSFERFHQLKGKKKTSLKNASKREQLKRKRASQEPSSALLSESESRMTKKDPTTLDVPSREITSDSEPPPGGIVY